MFGFGKKKTKPAKKSTARKAAPKRTTARKATGSTRKAAPVRKTRAMCVVCGERKQTNTTLRICGRKRCAADLRQRSQHKSVPAKPAAPRRAPATRRPKAPRTRPTPAAQARPQTTPATAPSMTGSELPGWWKQAQSSAQQAQIKDWNHHHRQHRDEIVHNAAALNQAAALLSGPDRAALNDIARTAAAITDDRISRAAEADTRAKRSSSTAAQLIALGDRLYALTAKYERAGVIRVNRP
ncbi:hypothetical protein AB0K15_34895 [Amycolatopsis sp. NPDC049253]|uniref:hypothetical protein n=1 Tax=Amycolatopsis sp. NPDC049253 TaxID=3155274 RepID=UPI00343CB8A6